MDAWAALWFWPVTSSVTPGSREQWIGALGELVGTMSRPEARKGRGPFADDATWAERIGAPLCSSHDGVS
jgi:hypothetical protein